MFRHISQLGACLLVVGFLLLLPCGGLRIKGDAEGMWLFMGPLQWAGGAALLAGTALTLLAVVVGSRGQKQPT